jgi:SpoVK/Ycf46/Vps4 family AAA+-type ATPase
MNDSYDLELLIKSHIPIIVIETKEEKRVIELLKAIQKRNKIATFQWTLTEGLNSVLLSFENEHVYTKPEDLLRHIKSNIDSGIYILSDFHSFLDEPLLVRLLKDIALDYEFSKKTIILLGHDINVPGDIQNYCADFELSLPNREARAKIVKIVAKSWSEQNAGKKVKVDPKAYDMLLDNLSGLTTAETKRLSRKAIFDDGVIDESDLPGIMKAKYNLLNHKGVLQYEFDTEQFADVGGLRELKNWLDIRKDVFVKKDNIIDVPKGVLLLGVQGCGKSLAAKAIAGRWNLPLLRLDFGAIYNKFHGETERNIRESLKMSESMSPCVLWIDEIEKGFSTNDNDSGTSSRVLGTLLTWMAEKNNTVFLVATANDIQSLPPELVRKGRFDEIFFVDLPKHSVRDLIFKIHLTKRKQGLDILDIGKYAQLSKGFSGAEIEQSVVAALYASRAKKENLSDKHIVHQLKNTKPLSVVMAERINALREWAKDRTVAAD